LACQRYESAVLLAGRRGLTQIQALANERFAVYLEEIGNITEARHRLNEAIKLYSEWGAFAKARQIGKEEASYSCDLHELTGSTRV